MNFFRTLFLFRATASVLSKLFLEISFQIMNTPLHYTKTHVYQGHYDIFIMNKKLSVSNVNVSNYPRKYHGITLGNNLFQLRELAYIFWAHFHTQILEAFLKYSTLEMVLFQMLNSEREDPTLPNHKMFSPHPPKILWTNNGH